MADRARAVLALLLATLPLACGPRTGGGVFTFPGQTTSTITADRDVGVRADGKDESKVTVRVRDLSDRAIQGAAVSLAATGSRNGITQPAAPTDENGLATGVITSTQAETKTISATVLVAGVPPVVLSETTTVVFVAVPSAVVSQIAVAPNTGVAADGKATATVTVTVLDESGTPLFGQTVTFAATGSGNTIVQPNGPTDERGIATGTIASTAPETKTVSATANPGADQVALAATADVTFVSPGP